MRNLKPLFFTLFILILSSLACTILPENIDPQPALPTASATINAPPTRAIIVPTLTPIPPPAVDPSAVPTESSIDEDEPTATATAIIEPTAVETAAIGSLSIIQPSNGASLVGGQIITVKGTAVGFDKGRIVTTLWLPDSVEPVSAETLVNENWQQTITLPTHFSGSAQLQTVVLSATDEPLATSAINFYIAADEADTSFITMDLPAPNTIFAPGEQLHLLGRATAPPAVFPLIVTLKTNNCQDAASTVTFNIIGSGDWDAFIHVPVSVNGAFCAQAIIGSRGSSDYRVVQHTFYAYADGDEAVIVQPAANSIHAAGEVQVHGALPLPAGSLVDIAIALPDGAELNPVSAELLDNHTFTVTLSTAGLSGPIKILVINPSDGTLLISRPITLK